MGSLRALSGPHRLLAIISPTLLNFTQYSAKGPRSVKKNPHQNELGAMDPISLGLGIAPLCLAALKGGSVLKKKTKALRHHGRVISRLRKKLNSQYDIFRDESQLLLQQAGVDETLAISLLDDLSHNHWDSEELESQLRKYLGRKYVDIKHTGEQINKQIEEIDEELSKLEDPSSDVERNKASSLP